MAETKTLAEGQARVYAYLKVNPDKAEKGQAGREEVTFALNTAQRFVAKQLPTKALGSLVRVGEHVVAAGTIPFFSKTNNKVIGLAYGSTMTAEIPLLSWDKWITKSDSEISTNSDLRSYYATELGYRVVIRPSFTVATTVVEVSVDDTEDMVTANNTFSTIDSVFEWVCMNAAALLLMTGERGEKLTMLMGLMAMWAVTFRGENGIEPPSVLAPGPAGKVV